VAEVVVIAGDELAYLKIDSQSLRRSFGAKACCCDVMLLGVTLITPLKSKW